jgi:hypothetical protein
MLACARVQAGVAGNARQEVDGARAHVHVRIALGDRHQQRGGLRIGAASKHEHRVGAQRRRAFVLAIEHLAQIRERAGRIHLAERVQRFGANLLVLLIARRAGSRSGALDLGRGVVIAAHGERSIDAGVERENIVVARPPAIPRIVIFIL